MCKALAGRLPTDGAPPLHRCFINPTALLLGAGSSLLLAPLGLHGSLQDLLNAFLAGGGGGGAPLAPSQPGPLGEALAMHFAAQLLRLVGHMHAGEQGVGLCCLGGRGRGLAVVGKARSMASVPLGTVPTPLP